MPLLFVAVSASAFVFTMGIIASQSAFGKKLAVRARIKSLTGSRQNVQREKSKRVRKEYERKKPSVRGKAMMDLSLELSCAGIKLKTEEFIAIWAACAFGPPVLGMLFKADWLVSAALFMMFSILPIYIVKRKKTKRVSLLEDQLSQAMIIIGNCLQTGLSFQHALESIVREMPEPISKEFGRVLKEVQLGLSMEKALGNMANRLKSKDFMLVVSAVLIQRQVGGNLSEILHNISDTIRERLKIKANLKVLTTTGRTSGKVVGLMPVFLMLILMVLNPSYVRTFFDSKAGVMMLIAAGALEVIGFLAVNKVIKVKY